MKNDDNTEVAGEYKQAPNNFMFTLDQQKAIANYNGRNLDDLKFYELRNMLDDVIEDIFNSIKRSGELRVLPYVPQLEILSTITVENDKDVEEVYDTVKKYVELAKKEIKERGINSEVSYDLFTHYPKSEPIKTLYTKYFK